MNHRLMLIKRMGLRSNSVPGDIEDIDNLEDLDDEPTGIDLFSVTKQVNRYVFDFLKTYLHALYNGILTHKEIKVVFFHAVSPGTKPVISRPNVSSETENGLVHIEDDLIHAKIEFKGENYFISLVTDKEMMSGILYQIVVSGVSPNDKNPYNTAEILIHEAINNSMYRGKILRVVEAPSRFDDENPGMLEVEIVKDMEHVALEEIFLPAWISTELRKFIECVCRYSELNMSVRYLLSGPPGTAKTQIVRSIAKACEGKATIILASGGDLRLNMLFSFAGIFNPSILCIDDLDLVVGERTLVPHKNILGTFLQKLDGFVQSHIFVLATTNDKRMVDIAASRPGRFDQIIDVGALESTNYLDLVKLRTDDQEITALFEDKEVLALLKEKKVVGAFLVNLVKQAQINKKTNGQKTISKKELIDIIEHTYRGFYHNPTKGGVGFSRNELIENSCKSGNSP